MPAWGIRLVLVFGLLGVVPDAAAASSGCDLSAPQPASVAAVLDGETLKLADGSTVRLIEAEAPRVPPGGKAADWPYAAKAKAAMSELALGKSVTLRYGGRKRDRHGYLLAQVFVADPGSPAPVWLQAALIDRGLARAESFADNQACIAELLVGERRARAQRLGIWSARRYRVVNADDLDLLDRLTESFQLVQGTVASVAATKQWVYVNFGQNWRKDFTVEVAHRDADGFAADGVDLMGLQGKPIRVRGWLQWRDGPIIQATHAAQIEILGDGGPQPKSASGE
jgi:endonuclease YncB( thermonuclease family)